MTDPNPTDSNVKTPAVAGLFYPADPVRLDLEIKKLLEKTALNPPPAPDLKVKALIIPHAGYEYCGPIYGSAYKAIAGSKYRKIYILGVSHNVWFDGIATCPYDTWKTPLGDVKVDPWEQDANSEFVSNASAFHDEHSIEVQLPFLLETLDEPRVVPLLTGVIRSRAEITQEFLEKMLPEDFLIVSTDLSHYRSYNEAQNVDAATIGDILELKSELKQENACGADGVNILLDIARARNWKPVILNRSNSGDATGDKNQVVGYVAVAFYGN